MEIISIYKTVNNSVDSDYAIFPQINTSKSIQNKSGLFKTPKCKKKKQKQNSVLKQIEQKDNFYLQDSLDDKKISQVIFKNTCYKMKKQHIKTQQQITQNFDYSFKQSKTPLYQVEPELGFDQSLDKSIIKKKTVPIQQQKFIQKDKMQAVQDIEKIIQKKENEDKLYEEFVQQLVQESEKINHKIQILNTQKQYLQQMKLREKIEQKFQNQPKNQINQFCFSERMVDNSKDLIGNLKKHLETTKNQNFKIKNFLHKLNNQEKYKDQNDYKPQNIPIKRFKHYFKKKHCSQTKSYDL